MYTREIMELQQKYDAEYYRRKAYTNMFDEHRQKSELKGETMDAEQNYRADSYYQNGIIKYGLGDCVGAIAEYSMAISLNPTHANTYHHRGILF
jgi:hypothetical protein